MDEIQHSDTPSREKNLPAESLVAITAGKPVADSRVVAKKFGKNHRDVLRTIDELAGRLDRQVKTPIATKVAMGLVKKQEAHPTIPDRFDRYYEMDRDAFTLVAMGFTGEEALQWKLEYIAAFNAMEAQLRIQHEPPPRQIETEGPTPEFQQYASERLHKIYSDGFFDPDHLLVVLFRGQIPYTADRKYRLYLEECCQALGITPSDPAFDYLPRTEIASLFVDTPQGQVERRAITESGLYFLNFTPRTHILTALAYAISTFNAIWQNLRKEQLLNDHPLFTSLDQALQTAMDLASFHLKRS